MHSRSLLSSLAIIASAVAQSSPSTSSVPPATPTVPYASDDPNYWLWTADSIDVNPQPIRGKLGADILGPQNIPIQIENSDALAPPTTDSGAIANWKWPFALSHNRIQNGGWARAQNINVMPVATAIAGVNMRLEAGAIREMHWHTDGEWAYMLSGYVRVSCLTPQGQIYLQDVGPGDVWYFPAGFPHSLQAKNTTADGAEFLLIFDNGAFSEDSTFLLTDWLAHVPKEVIAKNFQVDVSAFDHIPSKQLYIFPGTPPPEDVYRDMVIPNNTPLNYTFPLSKLDATKAPGGSYKVIDTRLFPASTTVCAADVTVEVGGMRELHWHPTQPEWTYFISGTARITVYASSASAQTFDFQAGDIAYIPPSYGHYVENTGNSTLHFLEIFRSGEFEDISLNQWLALVPPELVKAHLDLDDATIAKFSKVKQEVVGPAQPVA
ncbi:putative oxalate decarboxylase/oxidase [Boletus reticuloceps]|uniref:Putative oxalate decarboxylase/oxidase n=1 Tax=Boletus reticuloceps TaxID=495285 RepID=A0A8I2YQN5_9AGAM|nr:putative oxalate decarboxylase/oxidase [Boletus reticuloceps]